MRLLFNTKSLSTVKDKAWEHILARRGSNYELDQLRQLFSNYDMEDQRFTHLHCVVIGLRPVLLIKELQDVSTRDQLDMKDARGRTPLHWACDRGDTSAVGILVHTGAEVNVTDSLGSTPLIYAASSGKLNAVNTLLSMGADANVHTGRGDSPLHFASRHQSRVALVQALVKAGALVNHRNKLGNTPLAGAAMMNKCEIGRYLVQQGADIHTQGMYGDTPLFETIYHSSHQFMQMLLHEGARATDVNSSGCTILHATGLEGDIGTIRVLHDAGVRLPSKDIKNNLGETAWQSYQKRLMAPDAFGVLFAQLLCLSD